jgi:hypothetical protein
MCSILKRFGPDLSSIKMLEVKNDVIFSELLRTFPKFKSSFKH